MLLMFKIRFFSIFWKMKRLCLPLLLLPFSIISRSSRPEVFCKKGVLRNVTKFTGKHLCQSLFFNKVAGLDLPSCLHVCIVFRAYMLTFQRCLIAYNTRSHAKVPCVLTCSSANVSCNLQRTVVFTDKFFFDFWYFSLPFSCETKL